MRRRILLSILALIIVSCIFLSILGIAGAVLLMLSPESVFQNRNLVPEMGVINFENPAIDQNLSPDVAEQMDKIQEETQLSVEQARTAAAGWGGNAYCLLGNATE